LDNRLINFNFFHFHFFLNRRVVYSVVNYLVSEANFASRGWFLNWILRWQDLWSLSSIKEWLGDYHLGSRLRSDDWR
jgi:hypothetical protein